MIDYQLTFIWHFNFIYTFIVVIRNLAVFDCNKKFLLEHGVLPPLNELAKQPDELEQISK